MFLLFFQSLVIYSMVISLTFSFSHSELYGLLVSEAYSSISYLYFRIFHSFKEDCPAAESCFEGASDKNFN